MQRSTRCIGCTRRRCKRSLVPPLPRRAGEMSQSDRRGTHAQRMLGAPLCLRHLPPLCGGRDDDAPPRARARRRRAIAAATDSRSLKTAEPATNQSAPASTIAAMVDSFTPPSTATRASSRPQSSSISRACRMRSSDSGMKRWPPQPGLTLMTCTRPQIGRTASISLSGVPGLSVIPASTPRSAIRCSNRCGCRVDSM